MDAPAPGEAPAPAMFGADLVFEGGRGILRWRSSPRFGWSLHCPAKNRHGLCPLPAIADWTLRNRGRCDFTCWSAEVAGDFDGKSFFFARPYAFGRGRCRSTMTSATTRRNCPPRPAKGFSNPSFGRKTTNSLRGLLCLPRSCIILSAREFVRVLDPGHGAGLEIIPVTKPL